MPLTYPDVKWGAIIALLALVIASPAPRSQELVNSARAATVASTPKSQERIDALVHEARTLLAFDMGQALVRADEAIRLATETNDTASAALAFAIKAQAASRHVGPEPTRSAIQAAKDRLSADVAPTVAAEVWLAAARVHWVHDEQPECLDALRRGFDLADQANATPLLIKANILAMSALGWPEQPKKEFTRLLRMAESVNSPSLALECKVLLAVSRANSGEQDEVHAEISSLMSEAERLGSRSLQAYLEQRRSRDFAPESVPRALKQIRVAIGTTILSGNREQQALASDYAARLLLHMGRAKDALSDSKAAIEALDGMEMLDRQLTVFRTASQVALRADEPELARAYGERVSELQRTLDTRNLSNQKARLWTEANSLSRKLRNTNKDHQAELDAMTAQQRRWLLYSATTLLLVLAGASALLLRDRRRLRSANSQLATALDASRELQAERASLKENLQQIERLDSIGLLAGGFAHDFNNILVSVRGNTQLTLADPDTTASQRELLEQVLLASDRAAGLCKDILSYANSEPSPKKVLDVRQAIEGMVPLARAGFGSSIEVAMDLGERPALVKGDSTQIEQVLLNILVNAGDAIQSHGKIHIAVDEQTLDGTPPEGYWFGEFDGQERDCIAISVLDNGQGMSGDTIRRIFDPFFSTRFAGRGLGLAAAFGILRRHEGIVEVQSTVGKGTQFTIYLPRHDADALSVDEETIILHPPEPREKTIAEIAPATILVVDDEPSICEVVRGVLEVDGHTVITAQHGVEALELAEQYCDCLDLAILDVTMPGMDGPTLAQHLRSKVHDLPIVMMTGHAESAIRDVGNESQLLLKPFDLQALRNTINARLSAKLSVN